MGLCGMPLLWRVPRGSCRGKTAGSLFAQTTAKTQSAPINAVMTGLYDGTPASSFLSLKSSARSPCALANLHPGWMITTARCRGSAEGRRCPRQRRRPPLLCRQAPPGGRLQATPPQPRPAEAYRSSHAAYMPPPTHQPSYSSHGGRLNGVE
jgi:hypothetical protein